MKIFQEVDFIDGVQEFIESEYITELFMKGQNKFVLRGIPSQDSIRFSGDVTLFKKQVYTKEDLSIPSSWMLINENGSYSIIINSNVTTSEYTFTYVTYRSRALTKREGLYSVDYNNGIVYLSTPLKEVKINYRRSIQYIEGQSMKQVDKSEYTSETIYNIPTDSNTKLTYIYQLKNTPATVKSKEILESARVSLVTLGDIDD